MMHFCRHICFLAVVVLVTLLVGCDLHQFPDDGKEQEATLYVNFDINMLLYTEIVHETIFGRSASPDYTLRYVINFYQSPVNRSSHPTPVKTYIATNPNSDNPNCRIPIELPRGKYTVVIWADYTSDENLGDTFYDTSLFHSISLLGDHRGSCEHRDVFYGSKEIEIADESVTFEVLMKRPIAKFQFVATDVKEFLSRQEDRARGLISYDLTNSASSHEAREDMSGYRVVFRYPGFMPNVFNIFADNPIDAATGVWFESSVEHLNEEEAQLGFDYVFVNGEESEIQVACDIYDRNGSHLTTIGPIDVPIKRSQLSIVKGKFLTHTSSGGVGISPDFSGEFNIIIP